MHNFDKNETHSKVITIIAQTLTLQPEQISANATLEALGADSLDLLEIIMRLEENFGVEISDEAAAQIKTVNDIIDKIHTSRTK